MHIKDPRRILFLGYHDSGVLDLLKDLTGSAPEPRPLENEEYDQQHVTSEHHGTASTASGSGIAAASSDAPSPQTRLTTTSGLHHSLHLSNKYYSATLPIWIEEVPQANSSPANAADETLPPSLESWTNDWLDTSASEVIGAIGAFVIVFRASALTDERSLTAVTELMRSVSRIKENMPRSAGDFGAEWDGALLAVATSSGGVGNDTNVTGFEDRWADLDDQALEYRFEIVDARGSAACSAGTMSAAKKAGMQKIVQALEVVDWAPADDALTDVDAFEEEIGLTDLTGEDAADMRTSLLKADDENEVTVNGSAEEAQVEELEEMLSRLTAARDMSAHMSEAERRRFAARTVSELMKDL